MHFLSDQYPLVALLAVHSTSFPPAVREVGIKHHLSASDLCNGWVAFSTQHDSCALREDTLDQWEAQVCLSVCLSVCMSVYLSAILL